MFSSPCRFGGTRYLFSLDHFHIGLEKENLSFLANAKHLELQLYHVRHTAGCDVLICHVLSAGGVLEASLPTSSSSPNAIDAWAAALFSWCPKILRDVKGFKGNAYMGTLGR